MKKQKGCGEMMNIHYIVFYILLMKIYTECYHDVPDQANEFIQSCARIYRVIQYQFLNRVNSEDKQAFIGLNDIQRIFEAFKNPECIKLARCFGMNEENIEDIQYVLTKVKNHNWIYYYEQYFLNKVIAIIQHKIMQEYAEYQKDTELQQRLQPILQKGGNKTNFHKNAAKYKKK